MNVERLSEMIDKDKEVDYWITPLSFYGVPLLKRHKWFCWIKVRKTFMTDVQLIQCWDITSSYRAVLN